MNNYYVYIHIRLDNNKPFYVGKGSNYKKYNRAYDRNQHSDDWKNIVSICGYKNNKRRRYDIFNFII